VTQSNCWRRSIGGAGPPVEASLSGMILHDTPTNHIILVGPAMDPSELWRGSGSELAAAEVSRDRD